ncbi:MAG: transposase domain-containing protein [Betaproteobacteria bacterium]|nr:transposase domain-containing protein [Betaproteobacteria bacterium]
MAKRLPRSWVCARRVALGPSGMLPVCHPWIEPNGYLSGVLTAITGGHKQADINELLPWNYQNPV